MERDVLHPDDEETSQGLGIKNAIAGTVVIAALATVVSIPLGVMAGLFLAESDGRVAGAVRFTADVMTGVPSIVVGIFGYLAIVITVSPHFSFRAAYSGLAGAFAIGVIMLPIIMRAARRPSGGCPAPCRRPAWPSGPAARPSPAR